MASGCEGSKKFTCFQPIVSDQCVQYTGDPIPILGICTNDRLSEIEETVITALLSALDGTGIVLSDITIGCDFINNQLINKNKSLYNLIQILINSSCTLNTLITNLSNQVNTPVNYDLKCLAPDTTPTNTPEVLQAAINEICIIKSEVDLISTQLNNNDITTTINNTTGNQLLLAIDSCGGYGITKTGSASSAHLSFYGFVPPYCPVPCFAPLSNFDATGAGKAGTPYCGWYIMGTNGLPDWRGYTPVMATSIPGISFPVLDNRVDPTFNGDPSYNTNIGDKIGEVKHSLSSSEGPIHSHGLVVNPASHTHTFSQQIYPGGASSGSAGGSNVSTQPPSNGAKIIINPATINVTIASSGNSTPHENRQPSVAVYFIARKN